MLFNKELLVDKKIDEITEYEEWKQSIGIE